MKRKKQIATKMAHESLDALLLTNAASLQYVLRQPISRECLAAVLTSDRVYLLSDHSTDSDSISGMTWIRTDGNVSVWHIVALIVKDQGYKRIGFEEENITYREHLLLSQELCFAELVPASELLAGLRAVKEGEEWGHIQKAYAISEQAFQEILPHLQPGVSEEQVARHLQCKLLSLGAQGVSFPPIVLSGKNTARMHGGASEKIMEAGDLITLDFGCTVNGYCSDLTRTVALKRADDVAHRAYEAAMRARKAGISAIIGGAEARRADLLAKAAILSEGFPVYPYDFGHGIGLDVHESPYLSSGSSQVIPPGAVLVVEPGVFLEGKYGVRIEDAVFVTASGCRAMSDAPEKLLIVS